MTTEVSNSVLQAPGTIAPSGRKARRPWFPLVLVAVYWALTVLSKRLDLPIFAGFLSSMALAGLLILSFSVWWLIRGGGRLRDRFLVFLAIIGVAILGKQLADASVGGMGLILFGVPASLSAAAVWLLFTGNRSAAWRNGGMIAAFVIFCGSMALLRVDGINGDQQADVAWRWSTRAEDLYLASRTAKPGPATATSAVIAADAKNVGSCSSPDRETGRSSAVRAVAARSPGVAIATDWESHPPKQVWRQRIGPAWSSMLVIGGRLFTQEQRGESEAVVCLDAGTGREIWAHEYKARFSDGQAGAGPRSSPTFSQGRIYTLGGSGILSCLDAMSGHLYWSRDIVQDAKAPMPMWGFSSTPLVVDGMVVVYAGGKEDKGLLAYREQTGEPGWSVAAGPVSYSSAQIATVHGRRQLLFLSDTGLIGLDPASGKVLWEHKAAAPSVWRVALPRQIGDTGIVIGSEDLGLVRLDLGDVAPVQRWNSAPCGRPITISFRSTAPFTGSTKVSFRASMRRPASGVGRRAVTDTASSCCFPNSGCWLSSRKAARPCSSRPGPTDTRSWAASKP